MHARTLHAFGLAAIIALIPAGTASAAIAVSNTNDAGPGSIRQAIADAPPGETIVVPAGTYTLTSDELTIEKSLTISGHAPADTIIRSGGPFRVFDVGGAGNNITISGVTIRDGSLVTPGGVEEGAGLRNEEANVTLQNAVVTNNRADVSGTGSGDGGGVAEGGGVYSEDGALVLDGVSVTGNAVLANGAGGGGNGGVVEGGGVGFFEGSLGHDPQLRHLGQRRECHRRARRRQRRGGRRRWRGRSNSKPGPRVESRRAPSAATPRTSRAARPTATEASPKAAAPGRVGSSVGAPRQPHRRRQFRPRGGRGQRQRRGRRRRRASGRTRRREIPAGSSAQRSRTTRSTPAPTGSPRAATSKGTRA